MIKNILLATDLSANCQIVAQRAKQIADMFKAQISIVHVFEYKPVVYGGEEFALSTDVELIEIFEKNAHKALEQLGKDINVPNERLYFLTDSVKHSVVDLAVKLKTDLLIIGSHGVHGPALLLGSSANAILHAAKCNVLAVRI